MMELGELLRFLDSDKYSHLPVEIQMNGQRGTIVGVAVMHHKVAITAIPIDSDNWKPEGDPVTYPEIPADELFVAENPKGTARGEHL